MTSAAQTACPRCNAAVAAGAQFCGSCGASLGGAPHPPPTPPPAPQPPPYPSAPPMPQMARGYASGGSGNTKQANVGGSQQEAFAVATRAIQSNGGEVHWQQPPQAAKFLLTRKNNWTTFGFSIRYDGDLTVQPTGPGQNVARFSLKLQWNSAIGLLVTQVLFVIVMAMFNYYFAAFALILMVAFLAITAWTVSSSLPDKALEELVRSAQSGGGPAIPQQPQQQQHYRPQPQPNVMPPQPAPPPAPQPPPQAASAPPASGDAAAIVEQIKQLAGLRDAGAITPEEFEAKKAELLARI